MAAKENKERIAGLGCISTLSLEAGQAGRLPYFGGGFAANVGQCVSPVLARGNPSLKFNGRDSVELHPRGR